MQSFSRQLVASLGDHGITQADLADRMGSSRSAITKAVQGNPGSFEQVGRIIRHLPRAEWPALTEAYLDDVLEALKTPRRRAGRRFQDLTPIIQEVTLELGIAAESNVAIRQTLFAMANLLKLELTPST